MRRAFVPLMVREDLNWDEVARIAVHAPELPGVVLDSGLLRDYPQGAALAHVLGYVGAVNPAEQAAGPGPAPAPARVPHRQERHRAQLRPGPARPRRSEPGRGQRHRPRDPRARPPRGRARRRPAARARSRPAAILRRAAFGRAVGQRRRGRCPHRRCAWRWPRCPATTRPRSPAGCSTGLGASCATTRARRWSTNASAASTRRARPSR